MLLLGIYQSIGHFVSVVWLHGNFDTGLFRLMPVKESKVWTYDAVLQGLSVGSAHTLSTALKGITVSEGSRNYSSSEQSLESVYESRAEETSATPVDDPPSPAVPEPSCEEPAVSPQEESTQRPSTPSQEEAEPLLPPAARFPTQAESSLPACIPVAPSASVPEPFSQPASLPDPSAPPASLPDPSAPPASLPDPSAPPASLPDPSAPLASLPDPSAPPLSLPDPSAPHASWPCEDRGQMEEETDASPSDTAVKTGRQQEIDATSCPQDADEGGETEVKTPLLADQEQTLTKVVFPAGDSNESTFTHNTQVKTVYGVSAVPQHFAVAEDESNDVDLNERYRREVAVV